MTLTAISPTSSTPTGPEPAPTARDALSSDLDTFLKLLTAQIRNQDPLSPADGTEYAAQLAQFSNVEQAVRTNELLAEMQAALSGGDLAGAAAWIGLDVRHHGPVEVVQGRSTRLYLDIPAGAETAELVIYAPGGVEAARQTIDPKATELDWSGADGSGGQLASGAYTVKVEARAGGEALTAGPVRSDAQVREVALEATGFALILEGGRRIAPDAVERLRAGS